MFDCGGDIKHCCHVIVVYDVIVVSIVSGGFMVRACRFEWLAFVERTARTTLEKATLKAPVKEKVLVLLNSYSSLAATHSIPAALSHPILFLDHRPRT